MNWDSSIYIKNISEKLMVTDIVLISDDKRIPRKKWQIIGKDGNIWGAKLVVVSKSGSRNTCKLEVIIP